MKITLFKNPTYNNINTLTKGIGTRNYMYVQAPLKSIPGNKCACCGNEMLTHLEISKIWSKVTLPLKTVITNYRWNKVQQYHPMLYDTIVFFANKFPDKSLSDIILEKNEHVLFMDAVARSFEEANQFEFKSIEEYQAAVKKRVISILNTSACILKDAHEVISEIKPYEKYIRGYRKDIFQEFEYQSSKYPDKKLSEIIQIPELAEQYVENTYYEAMDFAKKRDYHWERADNIILKSNPELKDELRNLRTQVCLAYGNDDDKRVAYIFLELYRNFLKDNNLAHLEKDVMNELNQIPLFTFTKNSFLSYARRYYSDGLILQYLIRPFMETLKSIIPPNKTENNGLNNKIMVCNDCGDNLAQFPYTEAVKYHPEMIKNTEKQLQFVADKIIDGTLPFEIQDYPISAAKTLYNYSEGLINPDLSDYINKLKKIQPEL